VSTTGFDRIRWSKFPPYRTTPAISNNPAEELTGGRRGTDDSCLLTAGAGSVSDDAKAILPRKPTGSWPGPGLPFRQ